MLALGAGGYFALRGRAPDVEGLRVLDAHNYQTLQALVEVMFPKTEAIPLDAKTMDLSRAFDTYLADEPAQNIDDLKKALVLVEFGPLVFDRKLTTFSKLDPEARQRLVEAGKMLEREE